VGIEGAYEARLSDPDGVRAAVRELRSGALDGANVTMPLKAAALEAVDTASLDAIRAGAANTLFLRAGGVHGANTDIGGLQDVWLTRDLPEDAPVLVLGAGGVAGAALVALAGRELIVLARNTDSAEKLVSLAGVEARTIEWGAGFKGPRVLVNATPLGMRGEVIPPEFLSDAIGLVDFAYGSSPTPAVDWAKGRMPVADGLDLLVGQAARSFTLWTGIPAPLETMQTAVRS